MKKMLIVSLCAVAAMASVSCKKAEIGASVSGARVPAVVNAVAGNASKMSIDGLQTSWEMGDAISVFDATGKAEGIYVTEDNGKTVSFKGTKGEGDVLKYAVFPANPDATCTDGVISTTIPAEQDGTISSAIAVAEESDGVFEFLNATAVIKITIPDEMTDINFISFTANSTIAGDVLINELTAVPSTAEDAVKYTRVSIYKDGASITGTQYLTVIPGNYAGTVVLGKKDGSVRYATAIKVAAKDFPVDRIKNFGSVSEVSTVWVKNAVPGVYSVNDEGKKTLFAQGDIRYNVGTDTWRIADTYERLTNNPKTETEGEIDLFRWNDASVPGKFSTDFGVGTSVTWQESGDWTKKLPATGWSILTKNENKYLFATRKGSMVKQIFGNAYVGDSADTGKKYLIFYPDGWAGTVFSNTTFETALTDDDLQKLEDQGCAICGIGFRITKNKTFEKYDDRYFWSTTWNKTKVVYSYRFLFNSKTGLWYSEERGIESAYGFAVRPFYEIK